MKIRLNNISYPSLNVINGEIVQYVRKGMQRHYHYRSDPKLGLGIVVIRIFLCSCHACKNILSITLESKIKEAVNQPRYDRVYNCKYSQNILVVTITEL